MVTPSMIATITLGVWLVRRVLYGLEEMQTLSLSNKSLNMGHFPPCPPAFKQKHFFLQGSCNFYQNQAWLQKVSLCGVCSECGLIHTTPETLTENLRLLTGCIPSRKGVMRASTAAAFLLVSTPEKAFSPPFLRLLQAVTRTHDCLSKVSPSFWCRLWEGQKGTRGFCGQSEPRLNSGRLQDEIQVPGILAWRSSLPGTAYLQLWPSGLSYTGSFICHLLHAPVSFLRLVPSGFSSFSCTVGTP